MKKIRECRIHGCHEPLYLGGLCEKHHEESHKESLRRSAAIETLHTAAIDGRLPDSLELRQELLQIREWWDRACRSVNYKIEDEILRDEVESALEWSIAIAQEIIDEELAFRQGNPEKYLSKEIGKVVWERFENLEAGLMSNGVPRSRP